MTKKPPLAAKMTAVQREVVNVVDNCKNNGEEEEGKKPAAVASPKSRATEAPDPTEERES